MASLRDLVMCDLQHQFQQTVFDRCQPSHDHSRSSIDADPRAGPPQGQSDRQYDTKPVERAIGGAIRRYDVLLQGGVNRAPPGTQRVPLSGGSRFTLSHQGLSCGRSLDAHSDMRAAASPPTPPRTSRRHFHRVISSCRDWRLWRTARYFSQLRRREVLRVFSTFAPATTVV